MSRIGNLQIEMMDEERAEYEELEEMDLKVKKIELEKELEKMKDELAYLMEDGAIEDINILKEEIEDLEKRLEETQDLLFRYEELAEKYGPKEEYYDEEDDYN